MRRRGSLRRCFNLFPQFHASKLRECRLLEITTGQRKIRFFRKTVVACERPRKFRSASFWPVTVTGWPTIRRRARSSCPGASPHREAPIQGPGGYFLFSYCSAPSSCDRAGAPRSFEDETLAGRADPLSSRGRGHQKRGDHRNDRSSSRRSQSNRLKCNHHVNSSGQFIPPPYPFGVPEHSPGNLPLLTRPSQRLCDRDSRSGDPGADHHFCLRVTCTRPHQTWLDLRQVSASVPSNDFQTKVGSRQRCPQRPFADDCPKTSADSLISR